MARLRTLFFFSSRRRHTRWPRDWSSDVCSSDLSGPALLAAGPLASQAKPNPAAAAKPDSAKRDSVAAPGLVREVRSEERRVGKEWGARWATDGQRKERQQAGSARTHSEYMQRHR